MAGRVVQNRISNSPACCRIGSNRHIFRDNQNSIQLAHAPIELVGHAILGQRGKGFPWGAHIQRTHFLTRRPSRKKYSSQQTRLGLLRGQTPPELSKHCSGINDDLFFRLWTAELDVSEPHELSPPRSKSTSPGSFAAAAACSACRSNPSSDPVCPTCSVVNMAGSVGSNGCDVPGSHMSFGPDGMVNETGSKSEVSVVISGRYRSPVPSNCSPPASKSSAEVSEYADK